MKLQLIRHIHILKSKIEKSYYKKKIFLVKKSVRFYENSNDNFDYRKLTDACQTKAKRRKNTGITGITSTIGSNIA
jgi:hypothetical protein